MISPGMLSHSFLVIAHNSAVDWHWYLETLSLRLFHKLSMIDKFGLRAIQSSRWQQFFSQIIFSKFWCVARSSILFKNIMAIYFSGNHLCKIFMSRYQLSFGTLNNSFIIASDSFPHKDILTKFSGCCNSFFHSIFILAFF